MEANSGAGAPSESVYSCDFSEFQRLAERGNLVPVWREILADVETPVSAFLKLRGAENGSASTRGDAERADAKSDSADASTRTVAERESDGARRSPAFLLESVEGGENLARYSFMGVSCRATIRTKNREAWLGEYSQGAFSETKTELEEGRDPLHLVQDMMARYRFVEVPGLPRFCGGAVGFLGYDLVRFFEKLPDAPRDDRELDDCHLLLTDTLLIFDNVRHTIKILNNALVENDVRAAYDEACAKIDATISKLRENVAAPSFIPLELDSEPETPPSNFSTRKDFEAAVQKCINYIHAGDCVQVVPSQRFSLPLGAPPFSVYRALRHVSPAPYMFFLDFGSVQLIGASPEILVSENEGAVRTRPLAGTRRRGRTREEDEALELELLADPKERAEHVMLVDLHRNDIGRVCEYGSVEVDELLVVERFSHVMHIVSNIVGKLRADKTAFDLLRASFPAGTLSGAPKVRAMQIIDQVEPTRRGPYGGAIGYFSFSGNVDTCITLRTIVAQNGTAYVQAGGGVVADSVPADEYEETRNKARAALRAIALASRATS